MKLFPPPKYVPPDCAVYHPTWVPEAESVALLPLQIVFPEEAGAEGAMQIQAKAFLSVRVPSPNSPIELSPVLQNSFRSALRPMLWLNPPAKLTQLFSIPICVGLV